MIWSCDFVVIRKVLAFGCLFSSTVVDICKVLLCLLASGFCALCFVGVWFSSRLVVLWIDVIAVLYLVTIFALGWNCWELGSFRSVRVLGELVQRWDPNVVFLMETKIKKKAMEKVMEKIKFVNGLVVPSEGR